MPPLRPTDQTEPVDDFAIRHCPELPHSWDRAGTQTEDRWDPPHTFCMQGHGRRAMTRPARHQGTHTAADQLLTLAGSDALVRASPIGDFGKAGDAGLLTGAFSRETVQANTPIHRPINGAG